jgi:hypothetical protein
VKVYTIEAENYDDRAGGFYKVMEDGSEIARCLHAADANLIIEALNHLAEHKKPRPGLRDNY